MFPLFIKSSWKADRFIWTEERAKTSELELSAAQCLCLTQKIQKLVIYEVQGPAKRLNYIIRRNITRDPTKMIKNKNHIKFQVCHTRAKKEYNLKGPVYEK